MIDNRLQSFLMLCECGSYTKAARRLNMTQPAISQHIRYLEEYYAVSLVDGKGKNFSLSEEGKALREYIISLQANSERIKPLLKRISQRTRPLNFGATLTIGEYTMPPILASIFSEDPEIKISMHVENTKLLQQMLWAGEIDFALLEGHFNHSQFAYRLISDEAYIAVCSPDNPMADRQNDPDSLLGQTLVLREEGSGTRDILEQFLYMKNLSVDDFRRHLVIGNMNAIKMLCHQNIGITFMYREAVKKELEEGYLKEVPLRNFDMSHPFNFVYLKDSPDRVQIESWYEQIIARRNCL